MKQISNYILEKFKLNSKNITKNYNVGDIIENYKLNNKNYNLICVIGTDDIEDNKARFVIDDDQLTAEWGNDLDIIECENGEYDIEGYHNTNDICKKYKGNNPRKCAAYAIREKYGEKAYLPASKELQLMYDNLDIINSKLENKIKLDHYEYWSSTQYSEKFALRLFGGRLKNIGHHYKYMIYCLCPFVQI